VGPCLPPLAIRLEEEEEEGIRLEEEGIRLEEEEEAIRLEEEEALIPQLHENLTSLRSQRHAGKFETCCVRLRTIHTISTTKEQASTDTEDGRWRNAAKQNKKKEKQTEARSIARTRGLMYIINGC